MDSDYLKTAKRAHELIACQVDFLYARGKDSPLSVDDVERLSILVDTLAKLAEKLNAPKSRTYPRGVRIKDEDVTRYAKD